MRGIQWLGLIFFTTVIFLGGCTGGGGGGDGDSSQLLINMNQKITPLATPLSTFETLNPGLSDKPDWLAGYAVSTVVSPDSKTMLVLTSGYNRVFTATPSTPYPWYTPDSNEYVFIYDISTGRPIKKQVVQVPNTFHGIVFDPSGKAFYVAGGVNDNIHIFTMISDGKWGETSSPLSMMHPAGNGLGVSQPAPGGAVSVNTQIAVKPCAAGLAISNDGKTLVAANFYNDSITIFRGGLNHWSAGIERDLRPGKSGGTSGTAGGEYPFWVAVKGSETNGTAKAFVSSIRDREVVVVDLNGAPSVTARIAVKGKPNKMTLNKDQSLLYLVEDQTDTVDVINTATNTIVETIQVIAPPSAMPDSLAKFRGANSNSATLSPDEKQLYVTNGNLNCVAVVTLGGANGGSQVTGLIPTGWYPNSVSFSSDGNWVYVVNGKSATGANPSFRYSNGPPSYPNGFLTNQYNPQRTRAGLQSFPRPTSAQIATLTAQVASNNRFSYTDSGNDMATMAAVRDKVKHVIFIIKENRTYDQVLGDLEVGNGDPDLAQFGRRYTPNQHNLARQFVTLDNFYATAEVSNDGWCWTTAGRAPDVVEHTVSVTYAGRGLGLDTEGANRSVNIAQDLATRKAFNPLTPDDQDLLPGQNNSAAPDGPPPTYEADKGYLWDAALRKGLTIRNYGFFVDTTRYNIPQSDPNFVPLDPNPFSKSLTVAFPTSPSLTTLTDRYFRGFDNAYPDYYRFKEWEREFDLYEANDGLPTLSLVRFMHDHTGNYNTAIEGVNTPELQQADNDYAVGLLVEKISKSPKYKDNTLIFVIEDDAQDGGDHMDSHRTIAFVAGAYVKQGQVVSSQYNSVNFLRTIEEVLGLLPMNLNDALARPMADIFTTTPNPWSFTAVPAQILNGTTLPPFLDKSANKLARLDIPKSTRDAKYWAKVTKGMNFATEDQFDFAAYNRILWKGLMGDKPYPIERSGKNLRGNRKELLARYDRSLKGAIKQTSLK
ncbi:lipoprotein, putative [Citrifermentans bemidjiense Bem]|uniref:Lipoprotein, putative n=1 Tax=Citrifermentans bemidjiense (strain ATCC BAA-1014 / DSM 16622 / JCM 12645 / Bem) TaxID=404380 RepID=B5E7W0_CITBB|nr:beta-propeller fold lactonase family protein [Citrifermentans bemidjiense]ACH38496.1 lipoprotein, putative [Citrifermentans bemidjiense Bem]